MGSWGGARRNVAMSFRQSINLSNHYRPTRSVADIAQRDRTPFVRVGGDGESPCKRGSVLALRAMTIPLCGLPEGVAGGQPSFCLALLRKGFTKPHESLRMLVRSYRTVSPLPVMLAHPSAVYSLLHFPSGCPNLALASFLPCEAPTFLSNLRCRGHPDNSPSSTSVRTCRKKSQKY